jgi:preprotein translocase subunit SecE
MEIKKNHTANPSETVLASKKATPRDVIAEIKSEIGKISWTSKEELITYTQIVVGATVVFGIGIYFTDLIIQTTLFALHSIVSFIIG